MPGGGLVFRSRGTCGRRRRWCRSGRARSWMSCWTGASLAAMPAVRLVTGDGGAGKTRLALRLGEELTACRVAGRCGCRAGPNARRSRRCGWSASRACWWWITPRPAPTWRGWLDDVAADETARICGWCCWRAVPGSGGSSCWPVPRSGPRCCWRPARRWRWARCAPRAARRRCSLTRWPRSPANSGLARPDATLALADPDPVVLVVHAAALLAVARSRRRDQPAHRRRRLGRRCWRRCWGMRPGTGRDRRRAVAWTWT